MVSLLMGNGGSAPSMTQGHRWSIGGPRIGLTQPIMPGGCAYPGAFIQVSYKVAFRSAHARIRGHSDAKSKRAFPS